jgi:hypothetical protein
VFNKVVVAAGEAISVFERGAEIALIEMDASCFVRAI